MATLHVRNVPDPLYERLRGRAVRNGRSIGAEAVAILEDQLDAETVVRRASSLAFLTPGRRRRSPVETPHTRLGGGGSRMLVLAQKEARSLGHGYLGTEHLLLALLRSQGRAARALEDVGIGYEDVRRRVLELVGPGEDEPPVRLAFAPRAKKVLELALREALTLGHELIEEEHVLLGIVAEGEGVAAEVVAELCQGPGTVRDAVLRELAEPRTSFRAVDLEGPADRWTERLNELAAEGLELVEIVPSERGAVAVFRAD